MGLFKKAMLVGGGVYVAKKISKDRHESRAQQQQLHQQQPVSFPQPRDLADSAAPRYRDDYFTIYDADQKAAKGWNRIGAPAYDNGSCAQYHRQPEWQASGARQ